MPRTTRTSRRRQLEPHDDNTATAVLDHPENPEGVSGELFTPFDQSIPFFRAIAMMTDADWERCVVYLYRLDPKVRNPEKEPSYIDKFGTAFDEDTVKESHGGGRYWAVLTDDTDKQNPLKRDIKFRIDGQPKFLAGQTAYQSEKPGGTVAPTVLPPAAPAAAAETSTSAIRDVVREMLQSQRQSDPAAQLSIETMSKTMSASLEVMKTSLVREANSTTGNPLLDKMLDKLIENSINGKETPRDSRMDRLMDLAVARLLDPPQTAEQKDPIQQLGFVKDLLGVESLPDLLGAMKGGNNTPWWAEFLKPLAGLATQVPALLAFFSQQSQLNFQRQLALLDARRGQNRTLQQPQIQPPGTIPFPVQPGAAVNPGAIPPGAPVMPIDPTQIALTDIVVAFENGLDGHITAKMLRDKFPPLVEQLKPLLANDEQVMMFAQHTPPLNQIAGDAEFPQFLKEFCQEILTPEVDDDVAPATS